VQLGSKWADVREMQGDTWRYSEMQGDKLGWKWADVWYFTSATADLTITTTRACNRQ